MEKNKDKSHLIDQLYDYLEEQIQELKQAYFLQHQL